MAILKIHVFPDESLRQKSESVTEFDSALKKLTEDMLETMYDAPGVGLAANQAGILKRIVVIDVDFDILGDDEETRKIVKKNPQVFINPVLVTKSGLIEFKEGCLSVPGFSEIVKRFEKVKVKFQDVSGGTYEKEMDDILGVAIQHEIDHLDGKLFIDRLSEVKKELIKNKLLKSCSDDSKKGRTKRSGFHKEF